MYNLPLYTIITVLPVAMPYADTYFIKLSYNIMISAINK